MNSTLFIIYYNTCFTGKCARKMHWKCVRGKLLNICSRAFYTNILNHIIYTSQHDLPQQLVSGTIYQISMQVR